MYVCMYVCMFVDELMYACIRTSMHVYVQVCMCMYVCVLSQIHKV